MKRVVILLIVVGLVGLIVVRLFFNKRKIDSKKEVRQEANFKVAVNVDTVRSRGSEKNLTLVGTVTANQVIEVKSEVAGKITQLYFALGNFVTKGKPLARVDNKIRELSLSTADQSVADAKQNLERYTNLYQGGAATKAQLDQYKLGYEKALIQQEQAKKELSNAVITAPISGYVTEKQVESGAFVNMGTAIATIVDISQLKVLLNVPEQDVYTLKLGDKLKISATVYPGVVYQGTITFISFNGDASHNYAVEIAIKNNPENPLRAGTYVDVAFNRQNKTTSLQIAREALVGSLKNAQVYVVDPQSRVQLRKVTLGGDLGNRLEVISGLKAGDLVVTSGQINLADSAQVSIIH